VNVDSASVWLVQAGKDVHQRALPGPVLAKQSVDFTYAKVEIHVMVGKHAGKLLRDAFHLDRVHVFLHASAFDHWIGQVGR